MSLLRSSQHASRALAMPTRILSSVPLTPRWITTSSHRAQEQAQAGSSESMNWPTYLSLRRSQRLYGLIASIPTTFAGLSLGAGYFATLEAEHGETLLGLEPVYVYGGATIACVGLGWLAGPIVGNQVWRLTHRRVLAAMEKKDKDFYAHISRNRVDPSRQSVSNPVPDYYAEKVSSLHGYRRWLRDQTAYRRKAQFGDGSDAVH